MLRIQALISPNDAKRRRLSVEFVSIDTLGRLGHVRRPLHEQFSRFRLGSPLVPSKTLREITTSDWVGSNAPITDT